jgi:uncharacterized protein YoxC
MPIYPKGLDFEQAWAALMENREQQKETAQQIREITEQMKETQKETDRQIKKTERIVENNAQLIGKLDNRFGEMVEYMVIPNLITKFH